MNICSVPCLGRNQVPVVLGELACEFVQPEISNHTLPLADGSHPLVDGVVVVVVEHGDGRWSVVSNCASVETSRTN